MSCTSLFRTAHHARSAAALAVAAFCLAASATAQAQIRTDGSVGAAQTLSGPAYQITQDLGKLSGANLFHSFQVFNIGSGQSASFTTATPGITNVISRVTGGSASQINGLLQLKAVDGTPGFYFINPAGVVFGAGANIDVPGAFHVGTADHLAFPDGRFQADPQKASSFSSAAPEAFGFLGTSRAAISVKDGAVLLPNRGQAIGIAAGDVTIDNALVGSSVGSVRVVAVGAEALSVPLSGALPSAGGRLSLVNAASLISGSSGTRSGAPISVSAGQVDLAGDATIYSTVGTGASAAAGAIDIAARDSLSLVTGGNVKSDTESAGDAGAIRIRAGQVAMDSGGFVFSRSASGVAGRSGAIDIAATGALRLAGDASISTSTGGSGDGGAIRLQAADLSAAQAYVLAEGDGSGRPGAVAVDVSGTLALTQGGRITTGTAGVADAGAISVRSGALVMASGGYIGSLSVAGASGRSGSIDVSALGEATLSGGASVISSTVSSGNAGTVRLAAAKVSLDGATIRSNAIGTGGAAASGAVEVVAGGSLTLANHSLIDTSTLTNGNAGTVQLRAGDITLDGGSRVSSQALDGSGNAGAIGVTASGRLVIRDDAALSTGTSTAGSAGAVRVSASSLLMERGARIDSAAGLQSTGAAGDVSVNVTGSLQIQAGASITALTSGAGAAGSVAVSASGITLDTLSSISSLSADTTSGPAGQVTVATDGDVSLRNAAFISSSVVGSGRAGVITVRARHVTLDSAAGISSQGDAGRIDILASGDLALLNSSRADGQSALITTSTVMGGTGGTVSIRAANVWVDDVGGGVLSFARGTGNGGSIEVAAAGEVRVLAGGLSSTAFGSGAAGTVQVSAARVTLTGPGSGISAAAAQGSAGQPGSVQLQASERIALTDGSFVSISNQATVADPASRQATTLRLSAPEITLRNGAAVSADATGNVAASSIVVSATGPLTLDGSAVSTSANAGNGGAITATAGGLLTLRRSLLRTSVFGVQGNGGDITVNAGTLLLDSGFVQANTAARNASGGLVRVAAGALVASGNTLFLGGDSVFDVRPDVFGFNVIQAAAPTGVSGVIDLTSPVIDVTGSLRALRADVVDAGGLGRSLCQTSGGSSLALAGRGGLPASARSWQRVEIGAADPVAAIDPAGSWAGLGSRWAGSASPWRTGLERAADRGCL